MNIFEDAELRQEATIRRFRIVRQEGARQVAREVSTTTSKPSAELNDLPLAAESWK